MVHDERSQPGPGVELIVRPNNRYGKAFPGDRVLVDAGELRNHSTMSACMTSDEAAALEAERIRKEEAAAVAKSKRGGVMAMIDAGLQRQEDQAAAVEAAKQKADAERAEAEQLDFEKQTKLELVAQEEERMKRVSKLPAKTKSEFAKLDKHKKAEKSEG